MTKLEEMARAICCSAGVCARPPCGCFASDYRQEVLAALRVLREPDEGMVRAARDAANDAIHDPTFPSVTGDILSASFTAAIDHLLKEGGE